MTPSLDTTINALKAAGEPTRLRLLALLARTELTVTELTQILGQSQPRVSRHLKLLCDAGLLERFREGAWAFYRVMEPTHGTADHSLAEIVLTLVPHDDPEILRDASKLDLVRQQRQAEAQAYFAESAKEWERIRSLYVPEVVVESAMKEMVSGRTFREHLDLGTGTGRMLELFAADSERGVGVDCSHEMLSVARANLDESKLNACQVRQCDLYTLPFSGETGQSAIDLITIHQVLHYLTDPAAAVFEAARVLSERGVILIADFAPHSFEFLREEHAHRRLGFGDEEVSKWCRQAGLEVRETSHLAPHNDNGECLTVTIWLAGRRESNSARIKQEAAQ